MMTNNEFVDKLKLAANANTLYVKGGFGAPAGYGNNRTRYSTNNSYNRARASQITACEPDTFFFDCVCLGKGILWGWDADTSRVYGGAAYASNDVPDFAVGAVPSLCTDVSKTFDPATMLPGEWLYMSGHCGYYIGGGKVIEATPKWLNRVQVTDLTARKWVSHGKIKFLEYEPIPVTKKVIVCPCCGTQFKEV